MGCGRTLGLRRDTFRYSLRVATISLRRVPVSRVKRSRKYSEAPTLLPMVPHGGARAVIGQPKKLLVPTDVERETLQAWTRRPKPAQRLVLRSRDAVRDTRSDAPTDYDADDPAFDSRRRRLHLVPIDGPMASWA